jgi:hypothetical protein
MSSIQEEQVREVVQEFLARPEVLSVIEQVAARLRPPAQAMVIGGALRDVVLRNLLGIEKKMRDIDFLVFGLESNEELENCFKGHDDLSSTTFGGIKLKLDGVSVDIWRAELQMEVEGHAPPHERSSCSPQEALKYVTLTTDAIGYHLGDEQIYECGFYRAINRREIDLGERSEWLPRWVPYHLAHLASVWDATKFSLNPRVLNRIRQTVSPPAIEKAILYLEKKKRLSDGERILGALIHKARLELPSEVAG